MFSIATRRTKSSSCSAREHTHGACTASTRSSTRISSSSPSPATGGGGPEGRAWGPLKRPGHVLQLHRADDPIGAERLLPSRPWSTRPVPPSPGGTRAGRGQSGAPARCRQSAPRAARPRPRTKSPPSGRRLHRRPAWGNERALPHPGASPLVPRPVAASFPQRRRGHSLPGAGKDHGAHAARLRAISSSSSRPGSGNSSRSHGTR